MYGKRETNQEGIMGHPTIYPTGVTVYNPEKCWNGFTIFQALEVGAVLMNMNAAKTRFGKRATASRTSFSPAATS